MEIRKAETDDLKSILKVYEKAREFMKETGNGTQWGDTYPPEDLIVSDISKGISHVFCEDGIIHGVMVIQTEEESYLKIYDGKWLDEDPYIVIHRLAGDGSVSGIFERALEYCDTICDNIRADTHENNRVMRHILERSGFIRCGKVTLKDGTSRIAYQRHIRRKDTAPSGKRD